MLPRWQYNSVGDASVLLILWGSRLEIECMTEICVFYCDKCAASVHRQLSDTFRNEMMCLNSRRRWKAERGVIVAATENTSDGWIHCERDTQIQAVSITSTSTFTCKNSLTAVRHQRSGLVCIQRFIALCGCQWVTCCHGVIAVGVQVNRLVCPYEKVFCVCECVTLHSPNSSSLQAAAVNK